MLNKIPNPSSTCYFDTQWQIYWRPHTTAWAHLSDSVCEQKKQLSKHTGALWKFKSSPATFLGKQRSHDPPAVAGSSHFSPRGRGCFWGTSNLSGGRSRDRLFLVYQNNSRACVWLGKSQQMQHVCRNEKAESENVLGECRVHVTLWSEQPHLLWKLDRMPQISLPPVH